MTQNKKRTFYEVDPRYFRDSSGNGIGDLQGLVNKIDYFDFLGVDTLILKNILSSETDEDIQTFRTVAKEIGNLDDFSKLISIASSKNIDVVLEMNIGFIKEAHKWFKASVEKNQESFTEVIEYKSKKEDDTNYKYSSENKGYYSINDKTQEVPLNWKSNQVSMQFLDVIKFWKEMGINGFVFKKFEYLTSPSQTELMSDETLKELRKFFRAVKELDDSLIIIGESELVPSKSSSIYSSGPTKVFDYFLSRELSKLGISKKFGRDAIGTFKASHLTSKLKHYVKDNSIIVAFGNEKLGRVTSRWGNDGLYSNEAAKALGLVLLISTSSAAIYYGDEIGTLNIGLTHLDDFQDSTLNERKRISEAKRLSNEDFMNAQILQGSINSRSIMQWSDSKNAGFSPSDKTITPVSSTYKEINVANQYDDKSSTLVFYKELIKLISVSNISKVINGGKYKITSSSGVVTITIKNRDEEVVAMSNLTNNIKKVKPPKLGKVVISTHSHKNYIVLPTSLEPYEAVLISKDYFEEVNQTQDVKKDLKMPNDEKVNNNIDLKEQKPKTEEEVRLIQEQERRDAVVKIEKEEILIKKKETEEQRVSEKKDTFEFESPEGVFTKSETKNNKETVENILEQKEPKHDDKQQPLSQERINLDGVRLDPRTEVPLNHTNTSYNNEEQLVQSQDEVKVDNDINLFNKEQQKVTNNINNKSKFEAMQEDVQFNEKTSLKEEEIAPTTQIDVDEIEDFEDFINS